MSLTRTRLRLRLRIKLFALVDPWPQASDAFASWIPLPENWPWSRTSSDWVR